jgi:diguanylate cyclase (GGDEF)-like protein/PAS domain S-box-containing protein
MGAQLPDPTPRRRSERVSIAFPLEVAGVDLTGQRFSDKTKTTTVSMYGCCLPIPRLLKPDQQVQLTRILTGQSALGRVVAPMGDQPEGHLYGVETDDPCAALWGIQFASPMYQKLVDNLREGAYFVNLDRKITYWNEGAEQLSGYAAGEIVGQSSSENLAEVDASGKQLCDDDSPLEQSMIDGQPRSTDVFMRHKQGHRVPVNVEILPMRNPAGKIVGAAKVFRNSSSYHRVERRVSELEQLAFRDPLTGLPNRHYFELKIEHALDEQRRFGRQYGLLMFDIDRFRQANDDHGHEVGDALLKALAETLERTLRADDLVGRWGGEEFLVLAPDVDEVALRLVAERCRGLIAQSSVATNSSRTAITVSIGGTLLSNGDSAQSAIRRADELMTESTRAGGDRTTTA